MEHGGAAPLEGDVGGDEQLLLFFVVDGLVDRSTQIIDVELDGNISVCGFFMGGR